MFAVAFSTLFSPQLAMAQETVKIGVVIPLSGSNAQFGANIRNGLELALKDVNGAGGIGSLEGAKVELVYADTPEPAKAGAAVQRLVSGEKVVGIIGSFVSNITLAASEVTERLGVPMVTHSFADQITERGYRNIFQMSPKASVLGAATFEQAIQLGEISDEKISRIAILWEDTSYGTAQSKGIREAAEKAGVEVVVDEGYPPGITDVTPLINKLRNSGAQLVFPVSYINDAVLIIRSMGQQQIDTPVVGGAGGYIIPDFGTALGAMAEGVLSVAPANYDAAKQIADRYRATYGTWPSHEALMYAAGLEDMVKAIDVARSTDPAKIRDALSTLRFCEGFARALPTGCLAYDETGATTTGTPIMVQWQGGELVTVFPQKAGAQLLWRGKQITE
ncbi:ABC transporter substrate-binding protein [Paroceanicella profunda]|uniref:ABC transporter substrate-binding protein n=2 Tax=Paroceanicella profunda TaxID=2579971 RepID=A0A5B8G1M6_9RHOB|nr:ABC transporter substrate-binding protein [Paroceanicella profunda]